MAPSAVGSDVEDGATDVDPNTASFSITFVKAVDVSTVTTSTFFLVEVGAVSSISKGEFNSGVCDPLNAIPGTVTCISATECSFTPSSSLDSGKRYAICLTNEIEYEDNNIYPGQTITFTTAEAKGEVVPEGEGEEEEVPTDEVAPTITSVTPTANATGVAVNTTVQAVFSEAMDSGSIDATTFTLATGGVPMAGAVSYDAGMRTATFTPSSNLSSFTSYTAAVASTVKDVAGNGMGVDRLWSFTTSDVIAPSVSSVNPASNATEVVLNSAISIVFSEGVDPTTVTADNITVSGDIIGAITGTVSYDASAKTATFTPSTLLGNLQTYTVVVGTGVKDTSGNALASSYSWSFISKTFSHSLLYQKNGGTADGRLGWSVAGAGDVNHDGTPDFIVGADAASPGGKTNAGSAYVYSGANGNLLYQKDGAAASNYFGRSVAGVGDVNGDGYDDFIVGAILATVGGEANAGSAYVYSGANGNLLYQKDATLAGDHFGTSVAGAGDVNHDGTPDFIVGAEGTDPGVKVDAGSAYVYSGANGNVLYQKDGAAASDYFGFSVAGAGDVNGDGYADFIVGADYADPGEKTNAGSAYVYSGANGNLLYQKDGALAGDDFGISVAGAGDVNGDGRADFIVGADYADPGEPAREDAGSAYVYSGANGNLLYQKDGAVAYDYIGYSVAGAGDVDGDGYADFIIGAPWTSPGGKTYAGSAYLYSGYDGGLLYQEDSVTANDYFGFSVAGAGDVNGDGKPDTIIGAPYADPGGISIAGSVYIYISE